MRFFILILSLLFVSCSSEAQDPYVNTAAAPVAEVPKYKFPWLENTTHFESLQSKIIVPENFTRVPYSINSFGDWLRHLPMKTGTPEVLLFDGTKKNNQSAHAAVFNIDVGKKDLQQCADAVMRLRAEYLFITNQHDKIAFNFTSGDKCAWSAWKKGDRPVINGNSVSWKSTGKIDDSYANFKSYLNMVFNYAGSLSLSRELKKKQSWTEIESGDVIIKGGTPGHAVLVMDVATDANGNKLFLLAQSYMPAQEIQLLKNPTNTDLSPWYRVDEIGEQLITPEYYFLAGSLMTFGE